MTPTPGSTRAGVVYVAILIVCVVLLIGVSVYHVTMRQGRMAAYRSLDTQYAHSLARAGLNLVQASIGQAIRDPASPMYQKLLAPIEDIQAAAGGVFELDGGRPRDLLTEFPAVVDELTRDLPGGKSSLAALSVRVYLRSNQVKPLPTLSIGGKPLARGGREKAGRLFLECTAALNSGGLMGRVTQQVVAYQEFRVVHAPVPVFSDFNLFLREVPNGADESAPHNALQSTQTGLIDPGSAAVPLVLNNGSKKPQGTWKTELKPELLREQGWVFLGGPAVVLNLSYSQEETNNPRATGEDFHFYQQNQNDLEAGRANPDDALSTRANTHLGGNQFWQVRNWDMGVHTLKDGDLKTQYETIFEKTAQGRRLGAVLKLFGVSPDDVSPTVVFGHVLAGYFRIAAVVPADPNQTDFEAFYTILKDHGGILGFLTTLYREVLALGSRVLYDINPNISGKYVYMDVANPGRLLGPGNGASEETYKELCAGFRTRPYNTGMLHLKAGNQVGNPADRVAQVGLPQGLFNADPATVEHNQLIGALLPAPWSTALDKADLSNLDVTQITEALLKTCCFVSAPNDRPLDTLRGLNMLRGDKLDLGSTVYLKGALSLPALSSVDRGGMIIADEITLEGAVPKPAKGVLVLVAKDNGIRFQGGATQVHASLIALKGTLQPQGPPNVQGNMVGNRLDFGSLSGGGGQPAKLTYDPKLKLKPLDVAGQPLSEGLVVDFSRRFIRVD